jgi:hypothetical protein
MGLTKSMVRDRARVLLNELVEGFWLNSQLEDWVDDSAIDISTKTHCYEVSGAVTLLTGVQTYSITVDYLKIIGVIYNNKGLKKATPQMEGLQTAVVTGPPEYFFDITDKLGFFPIPTATENSTVATVYFSKVTDNIVNIPLKFKTQAVLFVVFMGLLKERQYAKAGQLYQLYVQSLNLDKAEIAQENTEQPPPQNQYVLKLVGPQK